MKTIDSIVAQATKDAVKKRKMLAKSWSELGDLAREASYVETENDHLERLMADVAPAVRTAREKLTPSWSRGAKDVISPVYNTLQKAVEIAHNTRGASSRSLLKLPDYYGNDHVFSRARRLAKKHEALIQEAEALMRRLSKALTGDTDHVSAALSGEW